MLKTTAMEGDQQAGADRCLPWLLLLAALLRAAYLFEQAGNPEWAAPALDAAFHDFWARALVSGDWSPPRLFADPQIHTTPYFRPPGYPYLLAFLYLVTNGAVLWTRALQMGLGVLNVWLGYRLGANCWGRSGARFVAFGLAISWTPIYFEGELLAPVLIQLLLLVLLLLMVRQPIRALAWRYLGIGCVLGMLALAVPNALIMLPVVMAWLWVRLRSGASSPSQNVKFWLLPLGLVLMVFPVTMRNWLVAGDLVLITSNAGVNLYIGNNPESDGYTPRIPTLAAQTGRQGWTCFDQPTIVRGVERLTGRELKASEVSQYFSRLAWRYASSEPLLTLQRMIHKTALFCGPIEVANNRELELVRADSMVLRWLPGWPVWWPLGWLGVGLWFWRCRRDASLHQRQMVTLFLVLAAVWIASYLPFFVAGRYRAPLLPLLLLLAAPCAVFWAESLRRHDWRRIAAFLGAAGLAFWFGQWRVGDYAPDKAQWHFQRADAWRMLGDLDRALENYRLAIAEGNGRDPLPLHNLGVSLLQRGDFPGAIAALRNAVDIAPQYLDALHSLAMALASSGDDAGAVEALKRVVRLDPDQAASWQRLGALQLRRGQAAAAVDALQNAVARDPQPASRYLLALALLDSQQFADGERLLAELAASGPLQTDANLTLAELWLARGQVERARQLLDAVLRGQPDHPGAKALRDRIR